MLCSFLEWTILAGTAIGCMLTYGYWLYGHFSRLGVKSVKPTFPFFTSALGIFLRQEHFTAAMTRIYRTFPGERYVGYFELTKRIIMLKDTELIKKICIDDFDHFMNHRNIINEDADSLFGSHLFALRGQKWKDMRATLRPAFTGSRVRSMFASVVKCAEEMTNFYHKRCGKTVKGVIEIEMKDAFSRYTSDVIASCAFGLKVNSLKDPKNEFYLMGEKATDFSPTQLLKYLGYSVSSKMMKLLNIPLFDDNVTQFFRDLVHGTMAYREQNPTMSEDVIQLLIHAKKGLPIARSDTSDVGSAVAEETFHEHAHMREWSDDELTAQALLFFVAGFDTSSTLLSFVAHELAANCEIQKRVQLEIDEVKAQLDGKLSYDDLPKLKYMDMVISETLRLWPPVAATNRVCVKPYTLPPPHESGKQYKTARRKNGGAAHAGRRERVAPLRVGSLYFRTAPLRVESAHAGRRVIVLLDKDDGLWIPIYAIHHDPEHFPNPETFDPERFAERNKSTVKPHTFLPFGLGPRSCLGINFALMEVKAIIFYLLADFEFRIIAKTQIPINLNNNSVTLKPKNGFWIGLRRRRNPALRNSSLSFKK